MHERIGITPASTHPGVATLFGLESGNYGPGVVQIFTDADLAGVEIHPGNWLAEIEREVGVGLTPAQLAERASTVIDAREARAILAEMGLDLPARVARGDQSDLCRSLRDMTQEEIDDFVRRARDRAPPPHCGG
ncbi:MAG TPA: hypothetical protein VEA99_18640 [Gemmatimonadaceae bacterium]|nr:hypothetical protein [Gemmatimonadaceae bacterium]